MCIARRQSPLGVKAHILVVYPSHAPSPPHGYFVWRLWRKHNGNHAAHKPMHCQTGSAPSDSSTTVEQRCDEQKATCHPPMLQYKLAWQGLLLMSRSTTNSFMMIFCIGRLTGNQFYKERMASDRKGSAKDNSLPKPTNHWLQQFKSKKA